MRSLKKLDLQATDPCVSNPEQHASFSQKENNQSKKHFFNICDLFEQQAKKTPFSTAVIFENKKLSFSDLDSKSTKLANHLRKLGVKPGIVVGLNLPKNENLIIGILGILKSGGVYLPLDPSYPEERLRYMMEDAKPSVVLTNSELAHRLQVTQKCTIVNIDGGWEETGKSDLKDRPSKYTIEPDTPAYIVYTSGSTGKPKGIVVDHKSLPNVVESRFDLYPRNPIALLAGSISFDPTLLTILYVLTSGGTLCIPKEESHTDLTNVIRLINEHSVDFLLCVTSFYSMLLEATAKLPTLKYVFIGGETLPSSLPSVHAQVAENAYLFNEYGPAEHAIGGTIAKIYDPKQKRTFPITIGKPLPNVQVYIMNEDLEPVPKKNVGEIYIGGAGLAKGYLNREALTAERFIQVNLKGRGVVRLYRTGDRGRILSNGNIEFLGRIDHQVKIWGYRIELEEIESIISQCNGVSEAIVVVQGKEKKTLIGFYSTLSSQDINKKLHLYLKRLLPSYMIPSKLIQIAEWPKTPNGKIDRKALLMMAEASPNKAIQAPLNISLLLREISNIWRTVLHIETCEPNENFFDLGGSSIQLFQVQALINNKFHLNINMIDLFQLPTISKLTNYIQETLKTLATESVDNHIFSKFALEGANGQT